MIFLAGGIWVDSLLTLPDDNCKCRDHTDMMNRCQARCILDHNSTCAGIMTEPNGFCIDQTCWTFFNYLCDNGQYGRDLSDFEYCIDCYPEFQ